MGIEHGEVNAREQACVEAVRRAVRDAAREHRMQPHEWYFALLNNASFVIAHQCGAPDDEGFELHLQAFVESARRHWEDHKRECMGKGETKQ